MLHELTFVCKHNSLIGPCIEDARREGSPDNRSERDDAHLRRGRNGLVLLQPWNREELPAFVAGF